MQELNVCTVGKVFFYMNGMDQAEVHFRVGSGVRLPSYKLWKIATALGLVGGLFSEPTLSSNISFVSNG